MIATLLLCLAATQDADRSTPEKTLEAMSRSFSEFASEFERIVVLRRKVGELGEELCTPPEKTRRVERRQSLLKEYPDAKMLGMTFEDVKKSAEKDGTILVEANQVMRMEMTDPKTGKKSVDSRKEAMRFTFVKTGAQWLIRSMIQDCKVCDGKGLCFACEGKGIDNGAPCRDCKGKKACSHCKGKKETDETSPDFYYGLVSEKDGVFAPKLGSPEETAQSYADYLNKGLIDQSRAEIQNMRRFLPLYRALLTPETSKGIDDAFVKAVADGTDRFKNKLPKVESVEKKAETATAIVKENVPPALEALMFKDFEHRIVMRKIGDRWLIEEEQTGCSCGAKEPKCRGCNGTGWVRY